MVYLSEVRQNVKFSRSKGPDLPGLATVAVVLGVVLGACSSTAEPAPSAGPYRSSADPSEAVARPSVDEVTDSIVRIVAFGCGAPAFGSGFAVESDLVVTSGHLVTGRDPDTLAVLLTDGTEIHATLVGFDLDVDLALLRLDDAVLEPVNLITDVPVVEGVAVGIRSEAGEQVVNGVDFVVDAPVTVNWDGVFRDTESVFRGLRINAEIRRGDSGSGLFINDRDVIGLIHSKNRNDIPRGYAVGGREIVDFLDANDNATEVVAERCA